MDYPAAHSMDTTWFAVDRDGYVAMFSTGEAGAIPHDAVTEETGTEELWAAINSPPAGGTGGWLVDPAAGRRPWSETGDHVYFGAATTIDGVEMFLDDLEPVRDALGRGEVEEIPSAEGVAVRWKQLSVAEFQRLHDAGACRYCHQTWGLADDPSDPQVAYKSRIYVYSHNHSENWIAGPYSRSSHPRRPIRLDELPAEIRTRLREVGFKDVAFAETPHIQPLEHIECAAWDGAWLSSDGKRIRPIPGMEELYAARYEDLQQVADEGYDIAPPPEIPEDGLQNEVPDEVPDEVIRDTPPQPKRWWEFWR